MIKVTRITTVKRTVTTTVTEVIEETFENTTPYEGSQSRYGLDKKDYPVAVVCLGLRPLVVTAR